MNVMSGILTDDEYSHGIEPPFDSFWTLYIVNVKSAQLLLMNFMRVYAVRRVRLTNLRGQQTYLVYWGFGLQ